MSGDEARPEEGHAEGLTGPREALRLIADRQFGPYFVRNALSASGTWFQTLASALLVCRLTGSAFLLGVLGFVQFLPVLASLVDGVIAGAVGVRAAGVVLALPALVTAVLLRRRLARREEAATRVA